MHNVFLSFSDALMTPALLCFVLGLLAGFVRSDLDIPEVLGKSLALYLMLSIGLKGGSVLAHTDQQVSWTVMLWGMGMSFGLPFLAYGLLKGLTQLHRANRASIAAHYGSVSLVTFAAATDFLDARSIPYEGMMVAVLALMETPALISGLWLAGRGESKTYRLGRHIFLNGSCVVLLGGFCVGYAAPASQLEQIAPFFFSGFKGALCFFLLEMGLMVARRLQNSGGLPWGVVMFGLIMPWIGASVGLLMGWMTHLSMGGTFLAMVLGASASYIAVPAAMRVALPSANPGFAMGAALGITFPMNMTVGLFVYFFIVQRLWE